MLSSEHRGLRARTTVPHNPRNPRSQFFELDPALLAPSGHEDKGGTATRIRRISRTAPQLGSLHDASARQPLGPPQSVHCAERSSARTPPSRLGSAAFGTSSVGAFGRYDRNGEEEPAA